MHAFFNLKTRSTNELNMTMEHFDVAVVGLGALGSAAAYHAAKKGAKVVGFEQFELGHVHGASHDTSRILRTSYFASEYVSLAKAAYKDWYSLEEEIGQKLVTITGGLIFLPKDGADTPSDYATSLTARGVAHEILDAKEVNKRWPQFKIPESVSTVYTEDSGIVHAAKSVAAMQFLARAHGAVLMEQTPVESVQPESGGGGSVVIKTPRGQFHADKVILATDAWSNKLLEPLGAAIPLTVMQEQVTYYKPTDVESFDRSRFPVWIWAGEKSYYGFPTYGEPTIKVGRDTSGNPMTPEQRTYIPSPKISDEMTSFLSQTIPDTGRQTLRTVTCQYTITPGREFILAPLEKHRDIILALGAAHAFKFAPAIGRVVAELALDGETTEDIARFRIPKAAIGSSKL